MRILLIEDDAALARSIAALLRAGGNAVDHVATGEDALSVIAGEPYALVILDVGLPGIDEIGRASCRERVSRSV